jgi:hypothetical protein
MKTFKFTYEDTEYNDTSLWPAKSKLKAEHQFQDDTTWMTVLYQFAKFLESTGYVGVVQKIQVEDTFGFHADCGFETFGKKEDDIEEDFDDTEEEQS